MDGSNMKRYVLSVAAAAAAGAAGVLWLKRSMKQEGVVAATDFDAFLVAPAPAAAPAARKPAKRSFLKPAAAAATDFESFLKVQPVSAAADEPCATDFLSFLKDGGNSSNSSAQGQAPAAAASASAPAEVIPESAVPVLLLYGTEYGFAREIAEKVASSLKEGGKFWPLLENAAHHPGGMDLRAQQAALLVFSTQGDGVPPSEARDFCDWLTAGKAGDLTGLPYAVCALGDTSYTHFCACGKALDAALGAAGASPLTPRVDVDKEDWTKIDAWIEAATAQLVQAAATGRLQSFEELGGVTAVIPGGGGSGAAAAAAAAAGYSKSRPYYARVVSVEGLCVLTHPDDKDTVKLELQLEPEALAAGGLSYTPGDALGIWPHNPPQAVEELLQQLGATGDEPVTRPSWHYQEQQQQQQQQHPDSSSMSLRHALSVAYDIKAPKAKPLLQLLLDQLTAAAAADDSSKPDHQQQQQQQNGSSPLRPSIDLQVDATGGKSSPASKPAAAAAGKLAAAVGPAAAAIAAIQGLLASDAAALDAYLAPRHVIDILQDYPAAKLTHTQLLGVLRPLQPRLYSISSTPLEYSPPNSGVAATIAVVRYTSLNRERQGVASTQVAERLAPGQLLPVFISKNPDFRLPPQPCTPIIMVGPGTGLAPFRSFILQRLLEQQQQQGQQGAASDVGPMHLFFGCRRRDQDFLYGQQLTAWDAAGSICLHTAFSREGAGKVYVQQRLREAGRQVWKLLQAGAHFYVCGDAGSMAGAVEAALLEIIGEGLVVDAAGDKGAAAAAAAKAYLQSLSDSGRYERDVWFS